MLDVINDKKLLKLFNELQPKVQSTIIAGGFRRAGKIILDEAKINFKASKKNKSKTEYAGANSMFKVKKLRRPRIGAVVGIGGEKGYKYRFQNDGTDDREYRSKSGAIHRTGRINKTSFFTDAVETKAKTAMDAVNDSIKTSMEATVKRYNK